MIGALLDANGKVVGYLIIPSRRVQRYGKRTR